MSRYPIVFVGLGAVLILALVVGVGGWMSTVSCGGEGNGTVVLPPPVKTGTVTGQVVQVGDASGPARGANVWVQGTEIRGSTDIEGRFRLSGVPLGEQTIVVSYRDIVVRFTGRIAEGVNAIPNFQVEIKDEPEPEEDKEPPDTTLPGAPQGIVEVESLPALVELIMGGYDNITHESELAFSWKLDNGDWSSWTNDPVIQIEADEGLHNFYARAKDKAGNIDPTPANFTFRVELKEDTRAYTLELVETIQFPKGTGEDQLLGPTDLAVHNGVFYFADYSMEKVKQYSVDGTYMDSIDVPLGAVAVDSIGNIFTCSFEDNLVQKLDIQGKVIASTKAIAGPGDVDLNEEENWALVTRAQYLFRVSMDSLTVLDQWGYAGKLLVHSGIDNQSMVCWSSLYGGEIQEIDLVSGQIKDSWNTGTIIWETLKIPMKDLWIACDTGGKLKGYRGDKTHLWDIELPTPGRAASACLNPDNPEEIYVLNDSYYKTDYRVLAYRLVLMD